MSKKKIQDYVELPNGGKLYLLPISQADLQGITLAIQKELKDKGEPLDPPTYTTEVGEVIEWDAASLEKDGTDEEKEQWAKHQEALRLMERENTVRVTEFVMTEAPKKYVTAKGNEIDLVIDELEPEWNPPEAWLKRQVKLRGYELPEDPYQRKLDFVGSLITETELAFKIVAKANALSLRGAVTDEGVSKMEAGFLSTMEQAQNRQEPRILAILERLNPVAGE